jgi:hypothetical protein
MLASALARFVYAYPRTGKPEIENPPSITASTPVRA